MSEKFSATLRIGDLNDFIAPSQACIVSVKGLVKSATASKFGSPELSVDPRKLVKADEPVKISLKDCLARCASAETVMLEKQSLDEFISNIDKGKTVIVYVSSQSRASLSVHFDLRRFRRYKKNKSSGEDSLPVLASSCPGWIFYAENTLRSFILPYISTVKTQQTMEAVVKHNLAELMDLRVDDMYHVSVMPCYDKKLGQLGMASPFNWILQVMLMRLLHLWK